MAQPQTSVSTDPALAFSGMLADDGLDTQTRSYFNGEASAEIAFGTMAHQGSGADEAIAAAATGAAIGVVVHSHAYAKDSELGTTGLKPGVVMSVLTRGRIWVAVEEAVAVGGAVRYRHTIAGAEVDGAFRTTADGTDCTLIEQGARWLSATTGAGFALLEMDALHFVLNPD